MGVPAPTRRPCHPSRDADGFFILCRHFTRYTEQKQSFIEQIEQSSVCLVIPQSLIPCGLASMEILNEQNIEQLAEQNIEQIKRGNR